MQKKLLKRCVLVIAVLVLYLYLANYYIYYRIGKTGLKPSDQQFTYDLEAEPPAPDPLTFVVLGDSLTAGTGVEEYADSYPYIVAQKLSDTGGIILKDFSVPGARTSQLIDGLLAPAIATNPDIVTVLIGTNDIHGRVSAASFEENYRYIIESLQSKTHARIYLVSIPFTGSDQLLFPPFDYYFHLETISFNKIIYNLSQTYGVGYIDIATPTEQNFAKAGIYYAADSFHPSAAGYKLWAQIIYDHIHQ